MDKNKSEKLKEILNQTISQEEIEAKLKKEIKATTLKKVEQNKKEHEEIKNTESITIQEEELKEVEKTKPKITIKEEPIEEVIKEKITKDKTEIKKDDPSKNKKVIIPSVRDKKKENRDINILLYLVGIIALLLFLVVIYLFVNKEDLSNSDLSINNNKISTEKFYEEKIIEKSLLEENEKIEKINEAIKNDSVIKEPMIKIQKNTESMEKEEKTKEVIKEVIKEKIVTKVVKLDKKNFKEYYNSSKFNSLKCYNFKAGDIFPTASCKNNLKKFLQSNKNAIRFEVIPVIAKNDNIIFDKMQSNIKNMNKNFQNRVKEYMYRGLSRERVLETTWYIKDILGEDTVLTPTNYYVKSKKNNKGIIIKAYH